MKKIFVVFCSMLIAVSVFSCSKKSSEEITLSYSIFFPATHDQAVAAQSWADEIEKKSKGRIKINMFPGGTLTAADQTFAGVNSGIADIGMSCFAYNRGRFPVMEAVDLPMGYPSGMAATKAANKFYEKMQPEELDDVKMLYIHAHGPGLLHTKKPVESLEDMKGLKVRSTGLSARVTEALGGMPIAMPQGDTYESLQRGVVDGTFGPIETLKGWNQGEVIDYTTDCRDIGYTTAMYVIMNKEKWESLPEDLQDIFESVSAEWIAVHGEAWDKADEDGREFTKSLGNSIIELSPEENKRWVDSVQSVIENYIAEADKKGLPGDKAVSELRKLID